MSNLSAPKKKRPTITFEAPAGKPAFNMLLNTMYKCFGAVFTNLKPLATTDAERELLTKELHTLRDAVREMLEMARGSKG